MSKLKLLLLATLASACGGGVWYQPKWPDNMAAPPPAVPTAIDLSGIGLDPAQIKNSDDLTTCLLDHFVAGDPSPEQALATGATYLDKIGSAASLNEAQNAFSEFESKLPDIRTSVLARGKDDNILWVDVIRQCVERRYYGRRVELDRASGCPRQEPISEKPGWRLEKPRTLDDAKGALQKAEDAARDAIAALAASGTSNEALSRAVQYVVYCRDFLRVQVEEQTEGSDSICGLDEETGGTRPACLTYGVISASLSYVVTPWTGGSGSNQLVAIASPFGAFRVLPSPVRAPSVGIDVIGVYSSFLSATTLQRTTGTSTKAPCSSNGSTFDLKLSCEANADVRSYASLYALGLTIGKKNLSYVQVVPFTIGLGQLGSDTRLRPYIGSMVGVLQVTGAF
jgi:hypothetical protein